MDVVLYYFITYSFLGWITETIFATCKNKHFVNRGFLYGPFCPIYGFGAILVIVPLESFKAILPTNFFLYFITIIIYAAIFTSLLEYITGYLLEILFHTTWWDYSKNKFNIKGRICLLFSIFWGLGAFIIWEYIHPTIAYLIHSIPINLKNLILYIIILYFIIDITLTVRSLINLHIVLNEMYKLTLDLKNELKENISDIKNEVSQKSKEITNKLESKEKITPEKLMENITNLIDNVHLELKNKQIINRFTELSDLIQKQYSRFFRAFPNIKSTKFNISLNHIKTKLKNKNNQ